MLFQDLFPTLHKELILLASNVISLSYFALNIGLQSYANNQQLYSTDHHEAHKVCHANKQK